MVISQGEIWWADLGEPIRSGPGYRRPVVVVQCDALNQSRVSTVVPQERQAFQETLSRMFR